MKVLNVLIVCCLSYIGIDINLLRNRRGGTSYISTSIERELEDRKRKRKWKKRKGPKGKFRARKIYQQKQFKFNDSYAKSHRYSNQKSLRRMYRNC